MPRFALACLYAGLSFVHASQPCQGDGCNVMVNSLLQSSHRETKTVHSTKAQAKALADYVYGDLGAASCPSGYMTIIGDEAACKTASAYLGDPYKTNENPDDITNAICNGRACGDVFDQGSGCENTRMTNDGGGAYAQYVCEQAADYVYGELGAASCPSGYVVIIGDEAACKTASTYLGDPYKTNENPADLTSAICNGRACGDVFDQGSGCENTRMTNDGGGAYAQYVCKPATASLTQMNFKAQATTAVGTTMTSQADYKALTQLASKENVTSAACVPTAKVQGKYCHGFTYIAKGPTITLGACNAAILADSDCTGYGQFVYGDNGDSVGGQCGCVKNNCASGYGANSNFALYETCSCVPTAKKQGKYCHGFTYLATGVTLAECNAAILADSDCTDYGQFVYGDNGDSVGGQCGCVKNNCGSGYGSNSNFAVYETCSR